MKTYNVRWEESFSVNVEAKSEKEAIKKVYDCKYDEGQVSSEISAPPEVFLMD